MPFLVKIGSYSGAFTAPTTDREIQCANACQEILARANIGASQLAMVQGFVSQLKALATSAFVSEWSTTVDGESITIPAQGATFNAVVDWGDNSPPETITSPTGFVHPYDTAGDYTISITGTFPNIFLNGSASAPKLKKVLNLGTVGWTKLDLAFLGCTNLTEFTAGSTDTSAVTTMSEMFRSCSSLTSLDVSNFDTSSVTDMSVMFFLCSGLTSIDVSSFDTGKVTNMAYIFYGCYALTSMVGVEDWDITDLNGVTDLNLFLIGGRMTTAQYDALLVKWEAQASGIVAMTPSFGTSTYTGSSAAATAHASLNNTHGWSIGDGGIA